MQPFFSQENAFGIVTCLKDDRGQFIVAKSVDKKCVLYISLFYYTCINAHSKEQREINV